MNSPTAIMETQTSLLRSLFSCRHLLVLPQSVTYWNGRSSIPQVDRFSISYRDETSARLWITHTHTHRHTHIHTHCVSFLCFSWLKNFFWLEYLVLNFVSDMSKYIFVWKFFELIPAWYRVFSLKFFSCKGQKAQKRHATIEWTLEN